MISVSRVRLNVKFCARQNPYPTGHHETYLTHILPFHVKKPVFLEETDPWHGFQKSKFGTTQSTGLMYCRPTKHMRTLDKAMRAQPLSSTKQRHQGLVIHVRAFAKARRLMYLTNSTSKSKRGARRLHFPASVQVAVRGSVLTFPALSTRPALRMHLSGRPSEADSVLDGRGSDVASW